MTDYDKKNIFFYYAIDGKRMGQLNKILVETGFFSYRTIYHKPVCLGRYWLKR